MKAYIRAIEYYLPERAVTNEELVQEFPEWSVDKIADKVGVNKRHIAAPDETSKDLAVKAAKKLFYNNVEIKKEDIDSYVFHQANKFMLNFLRKKIKIEKDKFHLYLSEVGNTVSSTIPITLKEKTNEASLNGNIVLAGFGVGYSWAGCVVKIFKQ